MRSLRSWFDPSSPSARSSAARLGVLLGSLALPLCAQATWTQMSPVHRPPVRAHGGMTFDAARSEVVLFGGAVNGGNTKLDDTWVWNGDDWTQRFPLHRPSARMVCPLVFDPVRQRVVLFGGVTFGSYSGISLNDTWEWDGADWILVPTTNHPGVRGAHALAYDTVRHEVVLFGGTIAGGSHYGDTWVYDGVDWTQKNPAVSPLPRFACAMAFDEVRGEAVLFGGQNQLLGTRFSDTWIWNGTDWVQHFPAHVPPARDEQPMTYDPTIGSVQMFGGYYLNDFWQWNGDDWTSTGPTGPDVRRAPMMAHDEARSRTVLFGGEVWYSYLDDTWVFGTFHPATFTPFGTGCAGHFGMPVLGAPGSRPVIGTTFTVACTNLPDDHFTTMWLGFSNTQWNGLPLPFDLSGLGMSGCTLYVSSDFVSSVLNYQGTGYWALPIPADQGLVGLPFHLQAASFDRVNDLGIITTNAATAVVGDG